MFAVIIGCSVALTLLTRRGGTIAQALLSRSMSLWTDFGFRENPYSPKQLPPTPEGEELLVGRDRELRLLKRRLTSSESHTTIEGDNGVGKSSLVAIAGFQMLKEHGDGAPELLIPVGRNFQLTKDTSGVEFERQVFYAVAHAFIQHHELLRAANLDAPDVSQIEPWLDRPLITGGGSVSTPFGGGGLPARSPNTSSGFDESGFGEAVKRWLRTAFPVPQSGGFLCVIDNLELLDTSQAARRQLEEIRDTVLDLVGLRWVLCGARGIVRSAAASARLSGLLSAPMEVGAIADEYIGAVVDRRIEVYGMVDEPFVPVDGRGFRHVYHVLNRNLRDAFQYAERFAFWLDENGHQPNSPDDRFEYLEIWLAEQAEESAAAATVTPKAWEVFDRLHGEFGGACSPGDYEDFEFSGQAAMRPYILRLEEANLVKSSLNDADARRKTITVTPTGWMVAYKRRGFVLAGS